VAGEDEGFAERGDRLEYQHVQRPLLCRVTHKASSEFSPGPGLTGSRRIQIEALLVEKEQSPSRFAALGA
jgi:hypothetical protein